LPSAFRFKKRQRVPFFGRYHQKSLKLVCTKIFSTSVTKVTVLLEAAEYARDRHEFSTEPAECPEFTAQGLDRFLRDTISASTAADTWDEGCLAGLMCTLSALPVLS
jgi:hypothetical protein